MHAKPAFQSRAPQQQYVQRNLVQNQTQQHYIQQQQHHQHQHHHHQQQQQYQQQQQWLRRGQLDGVADSGVVDEVEKTVQSKVVDSSSQDWKAR